MDRRHREPHPTFIRLALVALIALIALVPRPARAAYMAGITFSHPTPSYLPHGERVFVTLDYKVDAPLGARIYAEPIANGGIPAGTTTQPYVLTPQGTGTLSTWFTISSGTPTVDHVRLHMVSADETTELLAMDLRVGFIYGPSGMYDFAFFSQTRAVVAPGTYVVFDFTYATTEVSNVSITVEPRFNGQVVPGYQVTDPVGQDPEGTGGLGIRYLSGDVDVNQFHMIMATPDGRTVIQEFDIPVDYHWRPVGVYNLAFSKPSPASLYLGQHVDVSFGYQNTTTEDVNIELVPQHGGVAAPNGVLGFFVPVPPQTSAGSRHFYANAPGDFDALRIVCRGEASGTVYTDVPFPVLYHCEHSSVDNIVTDLASPAILDLYEPINVGFDYHTDHPGDIRAYPYGWRNGAYNPDIGTADFGWLQSGTGTVSGPFSGQVDGATMDHLRFQYVDAPTGVEIFAWDLPYFAVWSLYGDAAAVPPPTVAPPIVLGQNYPNPFNPTTTVPLDLAATGRVVVAAYDLRGRRVAVLADEVMAAGRHELTFDGSRLASGTYMVKVEGRGGAARAVSLVK